MESISTLPAWFTPRMGFNANISSKLSVFQRQDDYPKGLQRLITFGKIQRIKITKEPARDICPLAKVKAIRTNECFLL